ncbi:hypothetical protein [Trinickia soli]|uniref:hypothetical protein n=1 Tax=Trinickia soli TaxID=380675 RepID=UPI0013047E23|nr:hypothetical protein [Trinickia soli]
MNQPVLADNRRGRRLPLAWAERFARASVDRRIVARRNNLRNCTRRARVPVRSADKTARSQARSSPPLRSWEPFVADRLVSSARVRAA